MVKVSELVRKKGHQVHGIEKNTTIAEAAKGFLDKAVSSFLVYDGSDVVGIFTKNDLVRCCCVGETKWDQPVSKTMTTEVISIPPDTDLEAAFKEMLDRGLHHLPVMDGGKAVGMLTPIDILIHQKSNITFENQELMRYVSGSY